MNRAKAILGAVVAFLLLALAPVAEARYKLDIHCYTWTLEVCSVGSCFTQTCEQCDYWIGGEYYDSDVACY